MTTGELLRPDILSGLLAAVETDGQEHKRDLIHQVVWKVNGQPPAFMPRFIGGLLVEAAEAGGDLRPRSFSESLDLPFEAWLGPKMLVSSDGKLVPEDPEEIQRKHNFRTRAKQELHKFYALFFVKI